MTQEKEQDWTPTSDLRWREEVAGTIPGAPDASVTRQVLQQKWQGSLGEVKWVDVPIVRADPEEAPRVMSVTGGEGLEMDPTIES